MATMAGLFFVGGGPFTGFALGTIAVVGIAVIGSLTVLPSVLAWLGPKADAGRIPFLGRRQAAARPSRLWGALARRVVARPLIWGGVAASRCSRSPRRRSACGSASPPWMRQGRARGPDDDAIQRAFPQAPRRREVVVTGADVTGPKVLAAVDALRADAADGGADHEPVTTTVIGGGRALVGRRAAGGQRGGYRVGQRAATLRNQLLPDTLGKVPGVSYAVTGDTASTRRHPRAEGQPARGVRLRRGAGLRAAAGGVPVGRSCRWCRSR